MFYFNVPAEKPLLGYKTPLTKATLIICGWLAISMELETPVPALGSEQPQEKVKTTESSNHAGDQTIKADRKLLADLETAINARADHADDNRLDRELAAAFSGYGIDLDASDPVAAARGWPIEPRCRRSPRRSTSGAVFAEPGSR